MTSDPRIEPRYFLGESVQPLSKWCEVSAAVYDQAKRIAHRNPAFLESKDVSGLWWECMFLVGAEVRFADDPRLKDLPPKEPAWVAEIRKLAKADPVKLQHRLDRIAEAHTMAVTPEGMTLSECAECGEYYPCPTNVWATTDRDALATWDPADDEEMKD
jgi:hypothetical protein